MAHPDDAELWAGGTIARHVHDGGTAVIAVARHDAVRDAEAAAGARILGADLYLVDRLSAHAITTALTEIRPDILITHPTNDIHPHHRHCANEVLTALPDVVIATGHPKRAYHSDGYNNLDQHGRPLELPNIIDVSEHWQTKLTALGGHASQPITDHFGPMADALGTLHGQRIGTTRAEAFRAIPILGRLPATARL
ncbi:GlcNAc-PI de-N-acetylase [Dactylosporangium sp. NBC_01737]|uniref:PIG-L deacetylase family protein n=1 Tax=Dactylosporangium sp. NBC_01737 TaxID=2975959 RepID=UPI002E148317|nr:GlcNAc-PI de-N-acetylase [Dactylosporangium sp. NBC_01737]